MRPAKAAYLLRQHRYAYRRFWAWRQSIIDAARLGITLQSPLGWSLATKHTDRSTSLSNWMMQTTASDMLRIAVNLATDQGIEVVALVHDAVMIHCRTEDADTARDTMVECMYQASEWLLDPGNNDLDSKFAGATPFLHLTGTVVGGWLMARSALAARRRATDGGERAFLDAKIATARFYADHILPRDHWRPQG